MTKTFYYLQKVFYPLSPLKYSLSCAIYQIINRNRQGKSVLQLTVADLGNLPKAGEKKSYNCILWPVPIPCCILSITIDIALRFNYEFGFHLGSIQQFLQSHMKRHFIFTHVHSYNYLKFTPVPIWFIFQLTIY